MASSEPKGGEHSQTGAAAASRRPPEAGSDPRLGAPNANALPAGPKPLNSADMAAMAAQRDLAATVERRTKEQIGHLVAANIALQAALDAAREEIAALRAI